MRVFLWILYVVAGLAATACLARVVLRSKRRLEQRMDEAAKEGPPANPYQALAEIYASEKAEHMRKKTRKRR